MKKLWINDILETKRYFIKIPKKTEAEYMWNLIHNETVKYMTWEKWETYETTLNNIIKTRKKAENWKTWEAAIYDKETWKCIGRCWINRIEDNIPAFEIWYWITPEYYWRGIVPECVNRLLKYAFKDSNFEKVIIRCDTENQNSKKVAIKCWFSHEWDFKNHERIRWELRNTSFFGITRDEYNKY